MRFRLSFILPLLGFVILIGISGMALLATLSGNRDVTQLPSVLIGKAPPRIDLPLLSDPASFLDFSVVLGQVTVVNFFDVI